MLSNIILFAKFEIDVEVISSLNSGIDSDNIEKTVNYKDLFERVVSIFSEKKYNLIHYCNNKLLF